MDATIKHMDSSFSKMEMFEGVDFRRWQKKMHFMFSSMSVVYVQTTPLPEDRGKNPTMEQVRRRNVETSKELWDTLEAKYMAEDASSKKFLVLYIIDKLPPLSKDFKHTLKHLKEELTLIELGSHLRIEEFLRVQESDKPKGNNVAGPSVLNMVEHNKSSRYNDNKGKRKHHDTRANPNKKPKVTCWKCGKPEHLKKDCKAGNVGNRANGSNTNELQDGSSNPLKDRCWYKTYESLNDGSVLHMGNESTALVHGRSCVDLRAAVRLPDPKLKTLGERGIECIFVGYDKHFKAFKFYVIEPNDSVVINSIIESKDAIFDEHRFSSVPRPCQRSLKDRTEDWMQTFGLQMNLQKKAEAFLNGELKEKVYMNQPLGFIMPGNENKVCKLIKSLYGLKQAPKQWNQKFDKVVLSNGYLLNQFDKCVYRKFDGSGKGVIICLYVDDILIFGTDQVQVDLTKEFLSSMFSIKDMREADVILGIRIKHESNVSTPLDTYEKLMLNKGPAVPQLEYSWMNGCLMYVMNCIRPDIAFDVGKLSRYTSNPYTQPWQAIQRVLKYLKKTIYYRLVYSSYPAVLEGYTDASWISNIEDNSSTSGWVFLLGGGAIS
uniref:Zinc finger, CCHC-type n=1 Tax=Tanacetum cinerariifolium TaxID=118510 RepID=A0A6L2LPZ1_TANCI|nr:zinc finger, CCHC-type [Tanacetum cinerariifolium]